MRPIGRRPRLRGAQLCVLVLALAACSDPASIVGPPPNALPDRQSTTGERILITRGSPGKVFTIEPDGSNAIQLTTGSSTELVAAWAPDGKRVLFSSDAETADNYVIYVMNSDGTGVTRLTNPSASQYDRQAITLGKRIVFTRSEGVTSSLWMIDADGANLTRLTTGPSDIGPAPSPSGKLVAFARNFDIYVVDVETRAITNLTASASLELSPSWSPNGKQIAFARYEEGSYDIFVMNADGTQATQLTDVFGNETNPRWSPDGKRLVFTANYGPDASVWLISADGTGRNAVANTPGTDNVATAWAR